MKFNGQIQFPRIIIFAHSNKNLFILSMTRKKQSIFAKFLNVTEKVGNALPHPATLFALFAVSVLFLSLIASQLGWSAIHPTTSRLIEPVNLLNHDGIHRIMLEMVNNCRFCSFGNCNCCDAGNWHCRE